MKPRKFIRMLEEASPEELAEIKMILESAPVVPVPKHEGIPAWRPTCRGGYRVESRHQDEMWKHTQVRHVPNLEEARRFSEAMAIQAQVYGMTRVVDESTGEVLVTYMAGGGIAR